jgi:hypothetical protein
MQRFAKVLAIGAALTELGLVGYPRGIPVTYVSMTEDVGVPPALADQ